MSDRLDCPDCGGSGEQQYGPLTIRCMFCCGRGYVGDDNEPAERNEGEGRELHPSEVSPASEQLGMGIPGCPVCLGAGTVVSMGGDVRGGRASAVVEAPCPQCSG